MTEYSEHGIAGSAVEVHGVEGLLSCSGCRMVGGGMDFITHDYGAMLDHLELHLLCRHYVPADVFARIRSDRGGLP